MPYTEFSLAELTLLLPNLDANDWDEYIEEADGIEREFIVAQAVYARVLGRLSDVPVTAAKIGWLSLWSRLFGALTGGRGAAQWKSRLSERVMERVAFEASLHLQAVMLPVLEAEQLGEDDWREVRRRLCAYTAWCLRGDQLLCEKMMNQSTLDAAFDPRLERSLIDKLGHAKEAWQRLSGQQLELVSDQEAFFDRENARRSLTTKANRIAKWLSDPDLREWVTRLRRLESENSGRGAVTLFQLLDLPASVGQFVRRRGIAIAYIGYLMGSAAVHGSSLEATLAIGDNVVAPDFADIGGGFDDSAAALLSDVRIAGLLLELLVGHLDAPGPAA